MFRTLMALLLATAVTAGMARAESIANWKHVLANDKCNGTVGFFLWDSKRCLLESSLFAAGDGSEELQHRFHFEGKTFLLKAAEDNENQISFVGHGMKVTIRLRKLGKCDYGRANCTFQNYVASIKVHRPGKPEVQFQGVGWRGA